ncbi:hypothetical protein FB45DRAFT_1031615 [Roridomyces roridus]|uniref:Uncharacterized protein n=1 Tax=Roridomyces roridus TaxID=1738132 RepID=A0AAD7BKS7_9AGAR|nr:hypothetical protein FB45DRAFT_1031615 [Roridomyces roridus]
MYQDLLSALNAHPSLTIVALYGTIDPSFLASSTSVSLSKIVLKTIHHPSEPRESELHALFMRGLKTLSIRVEEAGSLSSSLPFSGMEELEVDQNCKEPASWLPHLVERQPHLKTIRFYGHFTNPDWGKHTYMLFPSRIFTALERESLAAVAVFTAYTLNRIESAVALEQWAVTQICLFILEAAGISAAKVAHSLLPRLPSLDLEMPRWGMKQSLATDKLVSTLVGLQFLRNLHLVNMHRHLLFPEGSEADPNEQTPGCLIANADMRRLTARLVRSLPSLEFVRIEDRGIDNDLEADLWSGWSLDVTYQAAQNRELEVIAEQLVYERN